MAESPADERDPGAAFTAEGGHGAVPTEGVPSGLPADGPAPSRGAEEGGGPAAPRGAEGPESPTPGGVGAQPPRSAAPSSRAERGKWPLWEVFVRGKRGLNHVHVGSLRASDERMALEHARDVYTRRNEGVSIWVVRSDAITASSPAEKDPFFAPAGDKVYRHPTFYPIPEDVPHL